MPIYYFSYGMLTDPENIEGAELVGPASLQNFEFELFAHANVHAKPGTSTAGVLWIIDRQQLGHLDQIEGYPHYYDRKTVPVFANGKRYEAEVYMMTPDSRKYSIGKKTSNSYIQSLIRGYNNAGISLDQIELAYDRDQPKQDVNEAWSKKYKSSINCSHPKGFSQKAHCAGKRKHNESTEMEMVCEDCGMCETHGDHSQQSLGEACWKGYHKEGMKTLFGKRYPNCVKNKNESLETYIRKGECPACGERMVSESELNEKQDACYHKVKSRYKVWPSAYASGALVQCRKKGAANWGNKSNESITQEEYDQLDENLRKWFSDKWVRFGPDGKIKGDCARGDDSEGKPKCLPQSKAHSLGKKGRASAAARKRREDPNPERSGKAINVSTKKKSNETVAEDLDDILRLLGIMKVDSKY